jgi:hypothetical protein
MRYGHVRRSPRAHPSEFGAGELFPYAADDDDPLGPPGRGLDLDDVAGVEGVETRRRTLVGHHDRVLAAGQARARIPFDAHAALVSVDRDNQ